MCLHCYSGLSLSHISRGGWEKLSPLPPLTFLLTTNPWIPPQRLFSFLSTVKVLSTLEGRFSWAFCHLPPREKKATRLFLRIGLDQRSSSIWYLREGVFHLRRKGEGKFQKTKVGTLSTNSMWLMVLPVSGPFWGTMIGLDLGSVKAQYKILKRNFLWCLAKEEKILRLKLWHPAFLSFIIYL